MRPDVLDDSVVSVGRLTRARAEAAAWVAVQPLDDDLVETLARAEAEDLSGALAATLSGYGEMSDQQLEVCYQPEELQVAFFWAGAVLVEALQSRPSATGKE